MGTPNLPDSFPPGVAERLGVYVYALRDPRDRSIFYVGKGKGDRVYSHVWVAMGETSRVEDGIEQEAPAVRSAKIDRIRSIYSAGQQVEHFILRRNITPTKTSDELAFQFEQVLIAAFRLAEPDLDNPTLTNIQGGHTSGDFVVEPIEETIKQFAAKPAGELEKPYVVLVSTNPALKTESDSQIYARLRGWWHAIHVSKLENVPVFVVHAGLVRAVFLAKRWKQSAEDPTLWQFEGDSDPGLNDRYRGSSLSYADMDPPRKNWSTKGWHRYT